MSDHGVKSLTPQQAWQLLQDDPRGLLVDIRSTMEYLFVGHPSGAVHVAWIDEPDWTVNEHFETEIRKLLLGGAVCTQESPCAPVILICRSGKRSLEAGKVLVESGMQNVFHIDEGFEGDLDEHHHRGTIGGWRSAGYPGSNAEGRLPAGNRHHAYSRSSIQAAWMASRILSPQ